MTRDLQIIGDNIEFMGWHVGNLRDVPSTVRAEFEDLIYRRSKELFRPALKNESKQ